MYCVSGIRKTAIFRIIQDGGDWVFVKWRATDDGSSLLGKSQIESQNSPEIYGYILSNQIATKF